MDEKNETGPAVEPKQEQQCKQARPHDELICELLDSRRPKTEREHAAAREIERLRCNAMQWRKPGPVTAEHPLDCLIVIPALRQADGDWWIRGSEFLEGDAPIAWCADTSIARAALAQYGIVDRQEDAA